MERLTFRGDQVYHIDDLVRIYNRYDMGHFFDKDTMRFFKSKLTSHYGTKDGEFYFVTSEKKCFRDNTRVWTLRKAYLNKEMEKIDIESISDFGEFETVYRAKKALENVLKGAK